MVVVKTTGSLGEHLPQSSILFCSGRISGDVLSAFVPTSMAATRFYTGIGKYHTYWSEPDAAGRDLIRKRQQREVIVRPPPNNTVFNVELELPKQS